MYILNDLLENICELLTASRNTDHNIVRVHTRKLKVLGDLSFPADTKSWFKLLGKAHMENKNDIFDCVSSKDELQKASENWPLSIENVVLKDGNVLLYLNKEKAFKAVINEVLVKATDFGAENVGGGREVYIPQNTENIENISLTDLKVLLLQQIVGNILHFTKHKVLKSASQVNEKSLTLTFTSSNVASKQNEWVVMCGPVLNETGTKDLCTTAEKLYSKRMVDMRLMAQHKYGVRVTSLPGWKDIFRKLGEAAVTIHLLQNKPQHTTVVKLNDADSSSVKGASFILYNCARLATLLKEFETRVENHVYPPLPDLQDVKFNLLVEPEEWELLFVYILRFPMILRSCISHNEKHQIATHYLILHLSGLASAFSAYYRRVRILMEPREHLFAVLHQRIYLLKSLWYVVHNSLLLLNIAPVKQM